MEYIYKRRWIILYALFVFLVLGTTFFNYQMDDEIHIGFYDYDGYPENADFEGGVVTVDETMGLTEGDLVAEMPAIHVDAGTYTMDIDHQSEYDFEGVIYDGDTEIDRMLLPAADTNTRYTFNSDVNLYNLKIDYLYNGKGYVTVKRSILYSVGRPFYYDTVL